MCYRVWTTPSLRSDVYRSSSSSLFSCLFTRATAPIVIIPTFWVVFRYNSPPRVFMWVIVRRSLPDHSPRGVVTLQTTTKRRRPVPTVIPYVTVLTRVTVVTFIILGLCSLWSTRLIGGLRSVHVYDYWYYSWFWSLRTWDHARVILESTWRVEAREVRMIHCLLVLCLVLDLEFEFLTSDNLLH